MSPREQQDHWVCSYNTHRPVIFSIIVTAKCTSLWFFFSFELLSNPAQMTAIIKLPLTNVTYLTCGLRRAWCRRHLAPAFMPLHGDHQPRHKSGACLIFFFPAHSNWLTIYCNFKHSIHLLFLGKKLSVGKRRGRQEVWCSFGKWMEGIFRDWRIWGALSSVWICLTFHLFFFRSNCVINLVPDKQAVLQEAYRVLKVRAEADKWSVVFTCQ